MTLICVFPKVLSFDGCAGYVNLPSKGLVSLKDVKVQLFPHGSNSPAVETEVAPKSGFFHVSYEKLGAGILSLNYLFDYFFSIGIIFGHF